MDDRAGVINEGGPSDPPELDVLDAREEAAENAPSGSTNSVTGELEKIVDGLAAGARQSYDELLTKNSPFGL